MTNKELYIQWAKQQDELPIFMQPWWMDAVSAGKSWDVLLRFCAASDPQNRKAEDIEAVMPYLLCKRLWMRWIAMPQQTQIGGIWLTRNGGFDAQNELIDLPRIAEDFASQLQALNIHYYYQQFPIGSRMVEPMQTLRFKVRERVTYQIEDLHDLDKVVDNFSKNKKRQLQKAVTLNVDKSLAPEQFYAFHRQCMALQKKQISYSREFFLVLQRKTEREQRSQIIAIRNADSELCAAAFLVWDKQRMYYLIPCFNPLYKESGANALLVVEAIKLAREKGVVFDFEGSMHRGTASHYKQFGSIKKIYYSVEKYYRPLFWIALLINKIRNLRYRI